MRGRLLGWFDRHARAFPWRGPRPRPAFGVLVAESLLQQTQAARAAPAYERFVRRFPDAPTLAAATADEVLASWQGLGYYQRALRLRRAALIVVERHGGAVPDDLEALRALPGVGRYTAHAIAAQAFDRPLIAVDANVRRLGARLLGLREPGVGELEAGLSELLLRPGDEFEERRPEVAEALIEVGACLCRPRRPSCQQCPLRTACRAAERGDPSAFPAPCSAPSRRREALRLLVARRDGCVALCRRPEHGRWAGLWGFPVASDGLQGRPLAGFEHVLTHRTLAVRPELVAPERLAVAVDWRPLAQVAAGGGDRPVAVVDQRVAAQLLAHATTVVKEEA